MNTRTFVRVRRSLAIIGILSILSTFVVSIPTAGAYSGADAKKAGLEWAEEAVDEACERELIDCSLAPKFNEVVNRAVGYQMLTMGFEVWSETAKSPLTGLGDWYDEAFHTAYTLGWTAGDPPPAANPGGNLTRAQLAVAAAAVLGLKPDAKGLEGYKDAAEVPSWAKGPMGAMVKAKLIGQSPDKMLNPNKGAIKAEVIVVLNVLVTHAEDNEIDVLEVAAEHFKVGVDIVLEALETGMNIDEKGELVAVELAVEEDEEEEDEEDEDEEDEDEEDEEGDEEGEEEVPPGEEVVPPVVPAGALAVALAADTSAAKTINPGASGVPIASFAFSVGDGEATISGVTFKRTGGGASTDFSSVALYQGAKRLKAGKTIATDTNTVEFSGLTVVAKPDAPVTLLLKANVATTAAAASTHQFGIEAATLVVTTAGSVTGVPVTSNIMTIGGATAGTLTVATVNTLSKPTLGAKGAEVGNFKLTAGSNDITFRAITLTHGGTVAKANLGTFKLTDNVDTTKVLAEAAAIDGDLLVFVLGTPYTVTKNNNRSFRVWADILGGKTTDTLDFYLDETSDIDALDSTIGYGAQITNSLTKALVTDTTFQGGKITLADNGPVASNVSTNTTNVHLFDFSLTSDRNVTVRDYYLWLEQTSFDGTSAVNSHSAVGSSTDYVATTVTGITTAGVATVNFDDAGATLAQYDVIKVTSGGTNYYIRVDSISAGVVTGTLLYPLSVAATVSFATTDDVTQVYDAHLRTRVKNLKLIDTDTGGTIASVTNTSYLNTFSDDFDLTTGKTRNFAVMADVDSTLAANNAFRGGVDFSEASTIKDSDANEFIAAADVVGGNTFGKIMTATASSLTVSLASTPVSQTFVKGQDGVNAVGLSVKAGDGGEVKVSKVILRLVADNDYTAGSFDGTGGYGDIAANTLVDTASLYKVNSDGTETKIAGPVGLSLVGTINTTTGHYKAEFSSLAYTVPKAATEKWVAKVKLKNTISSTHYLVVGVDPDNDIEAQDKDGNTVTPGGTTVLNIAATPTVMATIATSGSLTASQEGSPDSSVVVAGATAVPFAKYKFTATNESFTVLKLDVVGTTTASTAFTSDPSFFTGGNNVVRVSLSYPKADGTTETVSSSMASGKASFTNLAFFVPKDSSATITVLADVNTVDLGATSGASFRLGLNEQSTTATNAFEAQGGGSNEKKTVTDLSTYTNATGVNAMVVRKTVPTVAKLATAATKLNNGSADIAAVTIAADAKEAVSLKRLAFAYSSSDMDVSALDVVRKIGTGAESTITSSVSIRNRAGQNLKSDGSNLSTAGATTTDTIYVTWDKLAADQEFISKGDTNTYVVRATVANAAANESLSTYIADDTTRLGSTANTSNTAVGGIDELRTLAGVASGTVEASAASVSNTRLVFRWLFNDAAACPYAVATNGCAFLDVGGDGAFTVANDPIFGIEGINQAASNISGSTGLATGAIIPAALYYTTTDVNGARYGSDGGVYFDLATTFGGYTAGSDPAIAASIAGTAATNDGLVTQDFRFSTAMGTTAGSTGVFIDTLAGNAFTLADVSLVGTATTGTTLLVLSIGTAPAANAELFTASHNFIWSDNSAASHAASTNDWTNGVDIPSLPTQTLSLSF